jgi:hypothetical protein
MSVRLLGVIAVHGGDAHVSVLAVAESLTWREGSQCFLKLQFAYLAAMDVRMLHPGA